MLSAADPGLPPGDPPRPVCQRCGRSVDKAAIGDQVGLCHCMICEVYGCRWCWTDADGTCPSCGVRYAPAALVAVGPAEDAGVATAIVGGAVVAGAGGAPPLVRRPDIRAPLAIGTLVVALALLGLAFGGPLGSTAGSTEATPTAALAAVPGSATAGVGQASVGPSSGPSATATASEGPSSGPTATDRAIPRSSATTDGATPEPPASTATPAITPARTPRATPTPQPTPRPTPRPTPTPAPTPSCRVVPNLVGSTVLAARAAWTAAGFTGALTPAGHNTWIVTKQGLTVGACLAASTTIAVDIKRGP